jgi:hypothetical protein
MIEPTRWPQPWLRSLEAEIIASRSVEEVKAVWDDYQPFFDALSDDDYGEAWCHIHRLARLMFKPE